MSSCDATPHAVFLAECYAPISGADNSGAAARLVSNACAALRQKGADITYHGMLIVPDDELAYHVFTAADGDVIAEAGSRAELQIERIVPSVAVGTGTRPTSSRRALPLIAEVDRPVGHAAGEIGP